MSHASEVLSFLAGAPNLKRLPSDASPVGRVRRARTETCAESALASAWIVHEVQWWASPYAPEEETAGLSRRTAERHEQCMLSAHFVRRCLDAAAGFTIAPLATAWALHNVGIIPLIKWVQELQVPKETATWGHALAQLHARADFPRHDDGAQIDAPTALLLRSLCRCLVAAAMGSNDGGGGTSIVRDLDDELLKKLQLILVAYVTAELPPSCSVIPPPAVEAQPSPAASGIFRPAALLRSAGLLRTSRFTNQAGGTQRAQFALKQMHLLICLRPEEHTPRESAGAQGDALAALANVTPQPTGDHEMATALAEFVSEITCELDDDHLASALVSLANGRPSSGTPSKVLAAHPQRWLFVLVAVYQHSSGAASAVCGALCSAARALLSIDGQRASCESHGSVPLAGLLLAAYTCMSTPTSMDGYSEWLLTLAKAAAGDHEDGSYGDMCSRQQGIGRLVRALCELACVQRLAGLRAHLKLATHLKAVWQAAASTANSVSQYQELLRERIAHLSAIEAVGEEGETDRQEAAGLIEAALLRLDKDGGKIVLSNLARAKFLKPRQWTRHVLPQLLAASTAASSPAETEVQRDRRLHRQGLVERLLELMRSQKMLSSAAQPGRAVGSSGPADILISGTDWRSLLEALPELVAYTAAQRTSDGSSELRQVLASLENALKPAEDNEDASALNCLSRKADVGGSVVMLPRGAALQSAGGSTSRLLVSLLQTFARCFQKAGTTPEATWPAVVTEHLFFGPQGSSERFHVALWGWIRIAIAGRAGSHERPLALLLLSLGCLQRTRCARDGCAPSRCPHCDAHASLILEGSGRVGGCDVATLLERLPIREARERTWSMRLGAACLELASSGLALIDAGAATRENWRSACAHDKGDLAAGPAAADGTRPVLLDVDTEQDTGRRNNARIDAGSDLMPSSCAMLPARTCQLLSWLSQRSCDDLMEASAAGDLRGCMGLPGVSALMQQTPADARLICRWEALLDM